jgi:myosin heavy subunit
MEQDEQSIGGSSTNMSVNGEDAKQRPDEDKSFLETPRKVLHPQQQLGDSPARPETPGTIASMSRDDLISLCLKVTKRLRLLEKKSAQIVESHRAVLLDRSSLLELAQDATGLRDSSDSAALRAAWVPLAASAESTEALRGELAEEMERSESLRKELEVESASTAQLRAKLAEERNRLSEVAAQSLQAQEDLRSMAIAQEEREERAQLLVSQLEAVKRDAERARREACKFQEAAEKMAAELRELRAAGTAERMKLAADAQQGRERAEAEVSSLKMALKESEATADAARRNLESAKDELSQKSALVTRLRAENIATERKHAERTADVASSRSRAGEAEKAAKLAAEGLALEEKRRLEAESATAAAREELKSLVADMDRLREDCNRSSKVASRVQELEETLEEARAAHGKEVADLKSEAARRSQAAKSLLEERDNQLHDMNQSIMEMKSRADAAVVADSVPGLNVEYLKNVILQYMTFGASSAERGRLVPVISTLLEFSEEERSMVLKGLRMEWWGGTNRQAKEIHRQRHSVGSNGVALPGHDMT